MNTILVKQCSTLLLNINEVHYLIKWQTMADQVAKFRECDSLPFARYEKSNNNVILTIIALKGPDRDFLQSPHCAANCFQHVRSSGPGAIMCKFTCST